MKNKKCIICEKEFIPKKWNSTTCSYECLLTRKKEWDRKYYGRNSDKRKEYQKERRKNGKIKVICKNCKKEFLYITKKINYCSRNCYFESQKLLRLGKNNPCYRTGNRIKGSQTSSKHLRATAKYRKAFLEKNEYLYCENCKVNSNGTLRFETHHIYYASRFSKHKELHNFKNLILLCIQCHNDFHASKLKEKFKQLEKERGLKKLFTRKY